MAERVRIRESSIEEGNRLLRTVRRSSGSVVTWRRSQLVLLSAQGMDVAMIAQVMFTSPDRVRDVIHTVNADGFDSLRPKYAGGRPPKSCTEPRTAITQIALARPGDHGLPLSTWSLSKLADYPVAQGVVEDISHEGLRALLREQGVSFPGDGRVRPAQPPTPPGPAVGPGRGRNRHSVRAPAPADGAQPTSVPTVSVVT